MACVQCATPLAAGAAYCPECGRFVDDRIEAAIAQYFALNNSNPERAIQMGQQFKKLVPRPAWPHLADRLSPEVVDAWEMEAVPEPAPPAKKRAPRKTTAPTYRPKPPDAKNGQAVFMDFNEKPAQIVAVMDGVKTQAQTFRSGKQRVSRLLWLLFPLGIPFILLDLWLGYNVLTFSLVALVLWGSAVVGLSAVRKQGRPPQFDSRFDMAREIMHTLQDDVQPKRTMMGWLDLTGFDRQHKQTRQKKAPSGRPVVYYKDEWMRMKVQLYDGCVLRVSLIEKVKDRKGYWKRSRISGKQKWKSGSTHKQQYLQVAITANPEQYTVRPFPTSTT
ncbi:MAG: hypothetical protein KC443_11620, partial [Anaerolineales bacterium]|nr:hypothetical protein [Anaerolineales bacterium]